MTARVHLRLRLTHFRRQLFIQGRAIAQAVSRRPLAAEARVCFRVSPYGICGGQSGTATDFSACTSVFPSQFHSTGAPLDGKREKKLIILITGFHKKPQGCGVPVASAAGPCTTKIFNQTQGRNSYLGVQENSYYVNAEADWTTVCCVFGDIRLETPDSHRLS
jgi:hypothetical protein